MSLIEPDSLRLTQPVLKRMPTFREVVAHFATVPDLKRLATILRPYCAPHGTLDLFDGDQPPSALNVRSAVLNVNGLLQGRPETRVLSTATVDRYFTAWASALGSQMQSMVQPRTIAGTPFPTRQRVARIRTEAHIPLHAAVPHPT